MSLHSTWTVFCLFVNALGVVSINVLNVKREITWEKNLVIVIVSVIAIVLAQFCPRGKGAMWGTNPCRRQGQATTPATLRTFLCGKCMVSLTFHGNHVTLKMPETRPTLNSPYPRRLERPTICRYNYKGSTVLLKYFKTLSVGPVWDSNPGSLGLYQLTWSCGG